MQRAPSGKLVRLLAVAAAGAILAGTSGCSYDYLRARAAATADKS